MTSPRKGKSENSRVFIGERSGTWVTLGEWWAWVDLNHRPRPYQCSVIWFYNNLQDRGDCQNTRKSHKTSHVVGWVVGWEIVFKRSGTLLFAGSDLPDRTRCLRSSGMRNEQWDKRSQRSRQSLMEPTFSLLSRVPSKQGCCQSSIDKKRQETFPSWIERRNCSFWAGFHTVAADAEIAS